MRKLLKVTVAIIPLMGFSLPEGASILECKKLVYEGVIKCPTHYYLVEPVKLMPTLIKHHKELNLSKEQKERIKLLIRTIKERVIPLDRKIDEVSEKVRKAILQTSPEVKVLLKELAKLKVERTLYNYICVKKLKEILTEEQFRKLLQLAGYSNI
jgi:hypothetical protein